MFSTVKNNACFYYESSLFFIVKPLLSITWKNTKNKLEHVQATKRDPNFSKFNVGEEGGRGQFPPTFWQKLDLKF